MATQSGKKRINKTSSAWRIGLMTLAAVLALAGGAFAYTVRANAAYTGLQGQMEGMMSGYTLNHTEVGECNQMMTSYGINQTVVVSMDQMMSSGMMGMMH